MELNNYQRREREFYQKYYSQLQGAVITAAGVTVEEDPFEGVVMWPTIHISMPNGDKFVLEVSQDPEGNGPGFLFGLPTAISDQMNVLSGSNQEG